MQKIILLILLAIIGLLNNGELKPLEDKRLINDLLNNKELAQQILLDSAIIQTQAILLLDDSIMSEYIFNQIVLRPKLSKQLINTYMRHTFIDSACYKEIVYRIERDKMIQCCM